MTDALILIHSSIHATVVLHTIAGGQHEAASNNPINVQVLKVFLHNSNDKDSAQPNEFRPKTSCKVWFILQQRSKPTNNAGIQTIARRPGDQRAHKEHPEPSSAILVVGYLFLRLLHFLIRISVFSHENGSSLQASSCESLPAVAAANPPTELHQRMVPEITNGQSTLISKMLLRIWKPVNSIEFIWAETS